MTLFFLDKPEITGLFNIGTGIPRSWNEIAEAMFQAVDKKAVIEYIPMPDVLRDKYQYYTCADMRKLRDSGCDHQCLSLSHSVKDCKIRNSFSAALAG